MVAQVSGRQGMGGDKCVLGKVLGSMVGKVQVGGEVMLWEYSLGGMS